MSETKDAAAESIDNPEHKPFSEIARQDQSPRLEFEKMPTSKFSPLFLDQPSRRTVAVNAGDYRLYVGGYAINGAFAELLKQRHGLALETLHDAYTELHSALLAASRANGGTLVDATQMPEAVSLMTELKLAASMGIAGEGADEDEFGLQAASGAVFLHIFLGGSEPNGAAGNVAMLYVVGPKGEWCTGPKQGPLLPLERFLSAVERMSRRALEIISEYNRRTAAVASIQELRWCLVSGGVYCHWNATKLDVARATLRGMREAKVFGLEVVTFTYDEDIFQKALDSKASGDKGSEDPCGASAISSSPAPGSCSSHGAGAG